MQEVYIPRDEINMQTASKVSEEEKQKLMATLQASRSLFPDLVVHDIGTSERESARLQFSSPSTGRSALAYRTHEGEWYWEVI